MVTLIKHILAGVNNHSICQTFIPEPEKWILVGGRPVGCVLVNNKTVFIGLTHLKLQHVAAT